MKHGRTGRTLFPIACGSDAEVGNFFLGVEDAPKTGTGREASQALLREFHGYPLKAPFPIACTCPAGQTCKCGFDPQDWGRKFLPSHGGCAYIDLDHCELVTPETLSAFDFLAAWHATLRIARDALDAANGRLPCGQRIVVLVNSSDGQGQTYGNHMSFLISRPAFENIFHRKLHHMLFLASYFSSSIVFAGAGKVGSENGRDEVKFQVAQRADFCEVLTGIQTTYHRPIVNSRDEPLASRREMARLHVIFFDSTLCHGACVLKAGVTQVILAMLEREYLDQDLLLDDPVAAVARWSHDPDLQATARTVAGQAYTAVELQWRFFELASRFVATGKADGIVPRVHDVMALWEDTLEKLERDPLSLVSRLDWVLKKALLERTMDRRGLDWSSPEVKSLDHLYSSLDAEEGLYWAVERLGSVERFVTDGDIERFVHTPPEDTRAWTRAQLLRRWGSAADAVDWDSIRFRTSGGDRFASATRTLDMANPLGFTRKEAWRVFKEARTLEDALDGLEDMGLEDSSRSENERNLES